MATVSFRVPDDVKRQMDALDVNWSDVLRDHVEEELRRRRRRKAAADMDRMRGEIFRRTGKHANASEEVLRWRKLH